MVALFAALDATKQRVVAQLPRREFLPVSARCYTLTQEPREVCHGTERP